MITITLYLSILLSSQMEVIDRVQEDLITLESGTVMVITDIKCNPSGVKLEGALLFGKSLVLDNNAMYQKNYDLLQKIKNKP